MQWHWFEGLDTWLGKTKNLDLNIADPQLTSSESTQLSSVLSNSVTQVPYIPLCAVTRNQNIFYDIWQHKELSND